MYFRVFFKLSLLVSLINYRSDNFFQACSHYSLWFSFLTGKSYKLFGQDAS